MGLIKKLKKIFTSRGKEVIVPPRDEYPFTSILLKNQNFRIGRFTYGKPNVLDWQEGSKLEIGSFCSIAGNVTIFLGGNHRLDWISTYPFMEFSKYFEKASKIEGHPSSKGDVIIGNDVWLGYGCTILSGVRIGDGAVIGANTVVSKDVRPYQVVVGNPGRVIKSRFDESEINFLLELKWWDWPLEKIDKFSYLLCSGNLHELKKKINDGA